MRLYILCGLALQNFDMLALPLTAFSPASVMLLLPSCVPVSVNSADATEPLNRLGLIKDEFVEWSLQSGWQNCS